MNKVILLSISALFSIYVSAQQKLPLVYQQENRALKYSKIEMLSLDELTPEPTLPNPLKWHGKKRTVKKFKQWEQRRSQIAQMIQHYEIGEKPILSKDSVEAVLDNDTIKIKIHENGEILKLNANIIRPSGNGPFPIMIGIGMPGGSLPKDLYKDFNIIQIAFNFTQIMAHTQKRGKEPINKLYPNQIEMGAYAAWPWGVSRLIDGIEIVKDKLNADMNHIGITGCSFAGKMALYSGAFDERIALTIAQEPGGGGVDAWRVSETLGKVETLGNTSHEWFLQSMFQFAGENVKRLPIDHHELTALIMPRALLVLGNPDYEWLAEESNYVSCQAARKVWERFGIADRMGFSFQDKHMHCQLPLSQYPEVKAFISRFLMGDDSIDTNVTKAEMFKNVDYMKWMPWAKF